MLFLEDSCRKGPGRISFENGDRTLDDDRTGVAGVVREVDGASRDFHAVIQAPGGRAELAEILAAEGRDRGRWTLITFLDEPRGSSSA